MTIHRRTDRRGMTSYRAKVNVKDPDGGTWRSVYSDWTRSEARARRDERDMLRRRDAGLLAAAGGLTTAAYLSGEWLPGIANVSHRGRPLAPTTKARYAQTIERVSPFVGDVRLTDLRPHHVERMRDRLLAEGLQPQTVAAHMAVLSRALSRAVARGLIGRNAADPAIVNRPRGRPRDFPIIDPAFGKRILLAVRGTDPWDAAAHLALGLSLRREEVLGLGWSHVDLDAGGLRVERTLTYADGGLHFGPPKSDAGERDLEVPGFVVDALRRHRAAQAERRLLIGPDWPLDGHVADLVIDRGCGEPWHPSTFSTYWRRFANDRGLDVPFHGLRHGTAALLLASGVPDAVALAVMGHSAVAMLRRYQDVSRTLKRDAADRLDAMLRPD